MDLETIQNKSIDDLKTIAAMLGLEVPEKCTKAKLIKLIVGDSQQAQKPGRRGRKKKTEAAEDAGGAEETLAAEKAETAAEPENNAASEKTGTEAEPKKAAAAALAEPEKAENPEKAETHGKTETSQKAKGVRGTRGRKSARTAEAEKAEASGTEGTAGEGEGVKAAGDAAETVQQTMPADQEQKDRPEEQQNGGRKLEFSENSEDVSGLLDVMQEGYGFLRTNKYYTGNKDVFVAPNFIRKYGLRTGDELTGRSRPQRDNDKYQALFYITSINGKSPDQAQNRATFESLTPIYPDEQLKLETVPGELSTRLIDLIAPIGKGQRGMIVSPPKAGKTVLLKKIANAITENYPDVKLIVLLIDERPEEVTDMRESIEGEVVSSTFDEMPERHIKVAEMVFERSRRLVEFGYDVVILMDSLTRLARAYNITITPTGRSLSGGLDPGAMYNPKKFFGAARNIRGGGSLTIVATALIDTGSKMDDVIFEEFKGTGNMELHLDRKLSEKRVFPAIDINKSGTRKEELLLSEAAMNAVYSIRKAIANAGGADVTEMIVSKMLKTQSNDEFIKLVRVGIERPSN